MANLKEFLAHLFLPRNSNNHRARVLHPSAISSYISVLLVFQILLSLLVRFNPQILGYATNITVPDLLNFTNNERQQNGIPPVKMNDELSAAARAKAEDMFANQYWAHTSPTGRDPWSFIIAAGYNYLYAGENLARDFADSRSVVTAWMNSPSHRENVLNARYQEMGLAIVNGKYDNYETTLVVQMFGTRQKSEPTVAAPEKPQPSPVVTPLITPQPVATVTAQQQPPQVGPVNPPVEAAGATATGNNLRLDIFSLTKNIFLALTLGLMLVLAADALIVYRRRTVRFTGHSFAHMLILLVLLIALSIFGRGVIL